jgi:ubiquinone/menaquinone biosynthesis C-methylase UbiE
MGYRRNYLSRHGRNYPISDETFDGVVDIVWFQHSRIEDTKRLFSEVTRVLKPGGWFFSYRLGSNYGLFSELKSVGVPMLDEVTVEQIPDPFPLSNNGLASFWNVDTAKQAYVGSGLLLQGIDRYERATAAGEHVEYLAITARKAE